MIWRDGGMAGIIFLFSDASSTVQVYSNRLEVIMND
jgi:hypothetical protein